MIRSNSTKRISMSALSDTVLIEDEESDENHRRKRLLGILYVPPKLEVACSKCCCLGTSFAITIFFFIVTIVLLVVNKPPELAGGCASVAKLEPQASVDYSQVILVAGASDGFDYLDLNEKTLYSLPSSKKAMNLFDVYTEDTIYWVDESTWTIRSYPKEHSQIRYPKKWKITLIAADFLSEKLYLIESVSKSLMVIDVHTHLYRTIAADFENSTDIALDPMSGFLFVVKRSKGIFRIIMDGSFFVHIVIRQDISAITLDREAKIIYYATDYTSIASTNYDGQTYELLTKVSMKVSSISLLDETLFWSANKSLYFCQLNNGSCYNDKIGDISSSHFNDTTVIRSGSHRVRINNPCKSKEATECEDLCLITSNETTSSVGYVCSCRDGWQLGTYAKSRKSAGSCTMLEPPAPVNYSQVILMAGTKGFAFLDLNEEILYNLPGTNKAINLFDVYTEDTIYWVDQSTWTIRSYPKEHSKIRYPKTWNITSIAADFVNEKLYLLESVSKSLKVIDVHTQFYQTLGLDFKNSSDLAIDPMSGYLFVVEHSKGIIRVVMDGSRNVLIAEAQDISAITIDRKAKIIYYATDYVSIASKNYDGGNYKLLTTVSMKITSIALFSDTIFWSTNEYLYFCKITNGSCDKGNVNEISTDYNKNSGIIRTGSHHISISNPCDRDEADLCAELCLLTRNQTTATVDYVCSCRDGWQLAADAKSCESLPKAIQLPNLEQVVTFADNSGYLWFVDSDGKYSKPVQLPEHKVTSGLIFEVYYNNIFWCDNHTSTIKSLSWRYSDIRYPARWNPTVLRIDYITENMYILDGKAETINCIDIQGRFYGVVLSDIQSPSDFLLDPEQGLMFIALSSKSISRATMSGRSLTTIVAVATSITSFTIDRESQTIYYALNSFKIQSIGYYGTQSTIIQAISSTANGLSIVSGRLLWSDDVGLWVCTIIKGICHTRLSDPHAAIKNMKSLPSRRNVTNPCKSKNGDTCQQLCVLDQIKSSLGRVCACKTGWELQPDDRSCARISDFMLYTRGNVIRGRILNESRTIFTEAIPPTRFQATSLKFKDTIDFDYNWITHDFIFSDDFGIFIINLMDNEPQRLLLMAVSKDYHIKDVAYDWRTGNIYYVQKSIDNSTDHSLMVLRIDKSEQYQKTISSFTHDSSYPMKACPHSLVVHSERGYLFYTAWNGERKDIQRTATDGSGLKEIGDVGYHNKYHIIAIDYEDAKLYWIHDRWKISKIRFSDMNGNSYKQIEVNQPQYPTSIYIHEHHMYIGNSVSIWRYDKVTGAAGVKMTPMIDTTQVVAGVRIVSQFMQASNDAHPCVIENGGCQQFCFAMPQKKCECKDGQYIFQERFCKN